jgi:hypothetical protein
MEGGQIVRPIARLAIGFAVLAVLAGTGLWAADETPVDPRKPFIRGGAPENAIRHLGPRVERTDEGFIELPTPIDPPNRPHLTFKVVRGATGGSTPTGGALPSSRGSAATSSRESAERQVRDVIRKLG